MIAMAAEATTMRALVCRGLTDPARLRVEERPRPAAGDDGVLVRVHASSANFADMLHLSAVGLVMRGFKPAIPGSDFAGTVEATGKNVTRFKPGDPVFGAIRGAFAEYAVFVEGREGVMPKPAGVSFADAGTLAVAGSTALQALRDHGHLEAGDRVLVNGATGGVGTFLVQIAKALGGEVTAVCSTRNVDLVRSLGADTVIDYATQDVTRLAQRFDLIVDVAGSRPPSSYMHLLDPGAPFVCVGVAAIQHGRGGWLRTLARVTRISLGSRRRRDHAVTMFVAKLRNADLELLGELVAAGKVKPVIEKTYDLPHAGQALARIAEGHLRGKLAIAVGA